VPIFYFHVCDGHNFDKADEGQDLPDLEVARRAAIDGLRDILAGAVCDGDANLAAFIEVEDENHQLLFTVSVEDAVKLRSERGTSPRR
jgi:hypothetical protein